MDKFADAFIRNSDGRWLCRASAVFNGPFGAVRVRAGTTYCPGELLHGYDMAQWLDDWHASRKAPDGIKFF
jgi:hypothetical protein